MVTTDLVNTQLAPQDRVTPAQLWPDWDSIAPEAEATGAIDPDRIIELTRSSIDFLNNR